MIQVKNNRQKTEMFHSIVFSVLWDSGQRFDVGILRGNFCLCAVDQFFFAWNCVKRYAERDVEHDLEFSCQEGKGLI